MRSWCTAALPTYQHIPIPALESKPGSAGEDVDVAVFRFTLGIPGFDDKYVPRVIGAVGLLLLAVNHALGATPPPSAQTASEVVGGALATLCVVVPLVEDRLSELQPGKGRAAGEAVQGAINTFALAPTLSEQQKKVPGVGCARDAHHLARTGACMGVVFGAKKHQQLQYAGVAARDGGGYGSRGVCTAGAGRCIGSSCSGATVEG